MDELEEITTIDIKEITANDREVLMSYNIGPLSGPLMSALLILKSCILKCDTKDAWYNLAQHDQNKGMHFWGQLRNALFKEFAAREFTESTSNTTIGNIRRLISLMYPDLQTKTTQYLVKASKRKSTETDSTLYMVILQEQVRAKTKQKSPATLKNTMTSLQKLCKHIKIYEETDTPSIQKFSDFIITRQIDVVKYMTTLNYTIANGMCNILEKILPHATALNNELKCVCERIRQTKETEKQVSRQESESLENGSDIDKCRFTSEEMQSMADKCESSFEKLVFYILFTTGMRVGGFSNIKVGDVAQRENDRWVIKKQGRTLEKGNKIREFPLAECVRTNILRWLEHDRKYVQTSYLFPGKREGSHVCPKYVATVFKRLALAANIPDIKAHPHSARHTVCFLLAEIGNTPESIAKFIGHANATTTEVYYIKRSMHEHVQTMEIPWIEKDLYKPPTVPKCLHTENTKNDDQKNKRKSSHTDAKQRKEKKVMTTLNKIVGFQQALMES